MATLYKPRIVTDGLLVCYDAANNKSYVSGGATINNLVGPTAGNVSPLSVFTSSNHGALNFRSGSYINTNYTQSGVNEYTIEAWVKTNNDGTTGQLQSIVQNRGQQYATDGGFSLGLVGTGFGPPATAGNLFFILDADGIGVGPNSSQTYNDGNWHQLVGVLEHMNNGVTLDGTAAATYMKLYADGQQLTPQGYWNNSSKNAPFTGNGSTKIGWHESANLYFSGSIAMVRLYNKALTAAQVLQNYNANRGRYLEWPQPSGSVAPASGITFNAEVYRGTPTYDGPSDNDVHTLSTGIAVGKTAIAIVSAGGGYVTVNGITDSKGNVWTKDYATPFFTYLSAPITTALVASDTLTVAYSGSFTGWRKCISLLSVSGGAGFYRVDAGGYSNSSTHALSGDVPAGALVIGGPTDTSGHTVTAYDGTHISPWLGYSSNAWIGLMYKEMPSAGTYTIGATYGASEWSAIEAAIYHDGQSYLVNEDFDDAAYPSDWTNVNSGFEVTTTGALIGSRSLHVVGGNNDAHITFAPQDELWAFCAFNFVTDHQYRTVMTLGDGSGSFIQFSPWAGNIRYQDSGNKDDFISGDVPRNQTAYAWIHYKKSTGSDGVGEFYWDTTQTRPSSPNHSWSNSTCTGSMCRLGFDTGGGGPDVRWDKVRVSKTEIGSNPI